MSFPQRVFTSSTSSTQRVVTHSSSNGTQHIQTTTFHSGGGQPGQMIFHGTGWQQLPAGTTTTTIRYVNGRPVEEHHSSGVPPQSNWQQQTNHHQPQVTGDFNEMVLNQHNAMRRKHNVPPLTLDNTLNSVAQNWANRLAAENRLYHNPSTNYGENVFQGGQSNTSPQSVCEAFYSEIKDYRFGSGPRPGAVTGHFTQLVWKSSRKLGVGKATSRSGNVYVVCNYDPPGNYANQYNANVPPPS